jgi:hypothetical protein
MICVILTFDMSDPILFPLESQLNLLSGLVEPPWYAFMPG